MCVNSSTFKLRIYYISKSNKFTVQDRKVSFLKHLDDDFISLTDIAKFKNEHHPNDVIKNWMRGRNILSFLGLWEILNNVDFKPVEFDGFKNEAGYNYVVLSSQKWIASTNAILDFTRI